MTKSHPKTHEHDGTHSPMIMVNNECFVAAGFTGDEPAMMKQAEHDHKALLRAVRRMLHEAGYRVI